MRAVELWREVGPVPRTARPAQPAIAVSLPPFACSEPMGVPDPFILHKLVEFEGRFSISHSFQRARHGHLGGVHRRCRPELGRRARVRRHDRHLWLPAVRVEITAGDCGAASPRVIVGRDCELTATAFDDNGQEVRTCFAWSTGDPSIATVAPKPGFDTTVAEITGVEVGGTTIRVEVGADPDVFAVRSLSVIPSNNPN